MVFTRDEVSVSRCYFGMSQFLENLVSLGPSRTENRRSWSRLGLRTQHHVLQAHFQQQKFTKLYIANRLSVGLYRTARHSHNLCFCTIDSLSSCILKHLCYLVLTYELNDLAVHT